MGMTQRDFLKSSVIYAPFLSLVSRAGAAEQGHASGRGLGMNVVLFMADPNHHCGCVGFGRGLKKPTLSLFTMTLILSTSLFCSASIAGELPEPARDEDFRTHSDALVALGQSLFFDKLLSGNKNISCATCHHPVTATVDGLSTNIGTGGRGLSVLRDAGSDLAGPVLDIDPLSRGSRNMTPLFNLGHNSFTKLFWDGRLQANEKHPSRFDNPAEPPGEPGSIFPDDFDNIMGAVSILAITDTQEMTGELTIDNELRVALDADGNPGLWEAVVDRIVAVPAYVTDFIVAFDDVDDDEDITITHVGTAIGAFQDIAFRSDNSPFDRFLRGDKKAMSNAAEKGMKLFYGKAKCSTCHSGVFQTDNDFHAIGMPQIGPGFDFPDGDFGRGNVATFPEIVGNPADDYKFRTPNLRNVYLTGPWGHDGAFNSLEAVVRHHLDPEDSLDNYDITQIVMPPRTDLNDIDDDDYPGENAVIKAAIDIDSKNLSDKEVNQILDFLQALTDPSAQDLRKTVPKSVNSGLPLAEIRGDEPDL